MIDPATRTAIEELIVDFAWRIDHQQGHRVEELFHDDGEYVLFGYPVQGRAAIKALYAHRRSSGARTSRHLFSNVHITAADDATIHAVSVLTLHAADGLPPLPLRALMIADYDDVISRGSDGRWRFARRTTTALFQATDS
ncbi:nuclear transport factor 2 family protein [Mycolicibacterium sp. 120266]|uniref:nuclear transport factor 2 family protein n=1 Tax=Mycolicibacterium sp. 120266 TaxID=3090601 RepID=UPI00299F3AAF|nr:nuclear transport factor 2 family protein [Mycolicibacterium sp. 120266]MDX1873255.1 nuclear transport factor 2 family protein [Mycolicibacterium sp. 120266]